MQDKFSQLLEGGASEGSEVGFDWDKFASEGATDKPMTASSTEFTKRISEIYNIVGYIYPKKNYLSGSYDAKQGKEIYGRIYQNAVANGDTKYNEVKLSEDGSLVETGKSFDLKDSFSLRALMALDYEAYKSIKEGYYKVNLQEKKAEFLILMNVVQLANRGNQMSAPSQTEEYVEDRVSATSEDKVVSIIKLKNLIELAFDTQTRKIKIARHSVDAAGKDVFESLGFLVPSSTEVNRDGKYKVNFKAFYFDNENQKRQSIGDFNLPRVCNRSYEGLAPADLVEITNEKQVGEFDPTIDVYSLKLLKKTPKSDLEPGTTLQQLEEIPYEEQAQAWAGLGVTEKMLAAIRRSSSSSKVFTNAKINDLYEKGFEIYTKRKNEIQ